MLSQAEPGGQNGELVPEVIVAHDRSCIEIFPDFKKNDFVIGKVLLARGISENDCQIFCEPDICFPRPILLPIDFNLYQIVYLNSSCNDNNFKLSLICDSKEECIQKRSSIFVSINCNESSYMDKTQITKELIELSQTNMFELPRQEIHKFIRRLFHVSSHSKEFDELQLVLADKSVRSVIDDLSVKRLVHKNMIQDIAGILSNMLNVSENVMRKSANFGGNMLENIDDLTKLIPRESKETVYTTNHVAFGSLPTDADNLTSSLFVTFFVPEGGSISDAKIKLGNATETVKIRIAIRKEFIIEEFVKFSLFSNDKFLKTITEEKATIHQQKKIVSFIIGARARLQSFTTIHNDSIQSYPVRLDFAVSRNVSGIPDCAFWNASTNKWEFSGIQFNENSQYVFSCYSQHLTQFALLLTPHLSSGHFVSSKEIVFLSYCLLGLSCIGLGMTLVVYILYIQQAKKSQLGNQTVSNTKVQTCRIHVSLCAALFAGHLVFLAGSHYQESDISCITIGALLHLFYLHAFAWSSVEGVNIILSFVNIAQHNNRLSVPRFFLKASVIAWGIPTVVVTTTLMVSVSNYGLAMESADHGLRGLCFLKPYPFYIAFFVPILLSFVINVIIFIATIKTLINYNKTRHSSSKAFKEVKGFISIFILLNLTWLLGLLQIGAARQVFMYLFVIINGSQGIFVFLFYCILREDIRRFMIRCCLTRPPDTPTTMSISANRTAYSSGDYRSRPRQSVTFTLETISSPPDSQHEETHSNNT